MIVAEIQMLTAPSTNFLSSVQGQHNILFDCLETAQVEYQRIANLLERKQNKANDLPTNARSHWIWREGKFPLG